MRTRKITIVSLVRQQWRRLTASPLVVWDVGAVTSRIFIGQKLVFSQASCLAINLQRGTVLAYGDAAYRLLGNAGKQLSIMFPIDRGCLTDAGAGTLWLEYIRTQLWPRRRWLSGLRAPIGLLCLSESVGQADITVWKSVLENAGLASVSPVSGMVGLSWYLNLATADEPCFVIDLGGSQTQVGILIRGSVFSSKTMGRGGIDVTTLVQQWLLQKYHCQVSWRAAEQLKCHHGSLSVTAAGTKKIALKGKDPYTQLGMTATIELSNLQEMLVTAQEDLVLFIRQFLASVPAEIATKCLENGLWLAGGASQLHDLEQWLSVHLHTPVSRVQDPTLAVSKGIAIWKASQTAMHQGV